MGENPIVAIKPPENDADTLAVKDLFREYAEWLNVDLCFQGFDAEMARFPEGYDALLLAKVDGSPVGAVGVRGIDARTCEMKRMYVRDTARGLGLGERLAREIVERAKTLGYQRMVLDTLDRLEAARAIYTKLGFQEIPAYYNNPNDGVMYFALSLE